MSNIKRHQSLWWLMYPFVGLDVADEYADLDDPLFSDCTIISKKHIELIATPLYAVKGARKSNVDSIRVNLGGDQGDEKGKKMLPRFHSYLAVKRRGTAEQKESLMKKGVERARRVAAPLSLCFLARTEDGQTCALAEDTVFDADTSWMFDSKDGHLLGSASLRRAYTRISPIILTRAQINECIKINYMIPLIEALLPQKPKLPVPICETIVQASIRLVEALHVPTLSSQLLGAVTTLEVLLSEKSDFKLLSKRLEALLGPHAPDYFDTEDIFKSRNKYVHNSGAPQASIPPKALALAFNTLLKFAELAKHLKSKGNILSYLDLINCADQLRGCWNMRDRSAFGRLVKHERGFHTFPFIHRTL